jgi:hypothetical protein
MCRETAARAVSEYRHHISSARNKDIRVKLGISTARFETGSLHTVRLDTFDEGHCLLGCDTLKADRSLARFGRIQLPPALD